MIVVEDLSHSYGKHMALSNVSFEVGPGEVFGFVGPNGAGKTTTIRVLATLLSPSAVGGKVEVCGVDALADPYSVRRKIGFVPDSSGVYPQLSVVEYVDFFAAATGIEPEPERTEAVNIALDLTGMQSLRDRPCSGLSRGMRQRLGLARALVHDPEVLLLDEPASGLDPRARIELFELVRQLKTMGKAIVLSSHILTELASVVTHVGIIEQGTMVASGSARAVADMVTQDRVILLKLLARPGPGADAAIRRVPGVLEVVEREPTLLAVVIEGDENVVAQVVHAAVAEGGLSVIGVDCEWNDLERIFLVATKGELQ